MFKELEYKNGSLVVDELFYDPTYNSGVVVRIGKEYFRISDADISTEGPIKETALRPYKKRLAEHPETPDYQYLFCKMWPRNGFTVDMGRPITAEEFDELCKKYNLTAETISNEFDGSKGKAYGDIKRFRSIQIAVPGQDAITLEQYLKDKGIEAFSTAPGRVNINTDWGGYREGAGRKPSGRRLARIYVTEEEEKKLREYLDEIRKSE